jgi:hypothetical protein
VMNSVAVRVLSQLDLVRLRRGRRGMAHRLMSHAWPREHDVRPKDCVDISRGTQNVNIHDSCRGRPS